MNKLFFCFLIILPFPSISKKTTFDKIVNTQNQNQKEAINSQVKINKLDDETQKLLQTYRLTLKKIYNTKKYNEQLREFIKNQKEEMISLRKQIEQVKDTRKDIIPLMLRMLDTLEKSIDLDMPFLLEKRKKRIANFKDLMKRSDVSESEKYRRLLSIYEMENEYGQTISSYKGKKEVKGKELIVNFLRIGRVALIYQSLNKKHLAYWDNTEKKWKKLSRSYKDSISKALAISKKQLAPDLLKIPIPAPQKRTVL